MRLLDLFCGAGGAAKGYQRAGFYVVGVDHRAQPRYCGDEFYQADALEYLAAHGREFDVIHASPPCQAFIRSGMVAKDGRHPDLLTPTRELLYARFHSTLRKKPHGWALPFVVENVPGAPIRGDVMLCGSMFGLAVQRHRYFELSRPIDALAPSCNHSRPITGVYGHPHGKGGAWRNGKRPMLPSDAATWSREMGIDWMRPLEMAAAIPPAYTEWIGRQLVAAIPAPSSVGRTR